MCQVTQFVDFQLMDTLCTCDYIHTCIFKQGIWIYEYMSKKHGYSLKNSKTLVDSLVIQAPQRVYFFLYIWLDCLNVLDSRRRPFEHSDPYLCAHDGVPILRCIWPRYSTTIICHFLFVIRLVSTQRFCLIHSVRLDHSNAPQEERKYHVSWGNQARQLQSYLNKNRTNVQILCPVKHLVCHNYKTSLKRRCIGFT